MRIGHRDAESWALQSVGMGRLCERPGCSEPAAVAYGMRPEDLVFWLDALDNVSDLGNGVLCLRHADAMVVPRNWTLDDHRDPDLHLFRPPNESVERRRSSRRIDRSTGEIEQLEFGVDPEAVAASEREPGNVPGSNVPAAPAAELDPDADGATDDAWSPAFDDADDLDGLLAARSPLLARAFRGDDRPKG